ncbi:hypothetical protein P8452_50705 [Trifolium repens]|nr:hypothetical protein P8452_50705 [Trifolium repens]
MVGDSAFNTAASNPTNTVYDAKRLIEQCDFEYYARALSNVFDPIFLNIIKHDMIDVKKGTVNDKKKRHWLLFVGKYALQLLCHPGTGNIIGLTSVIFDILSKR